MPQQTVKITNQSGLHARPAALLVQETGKFACDVKISKDGKEVDAKSILGIMSLAISAGDEITVVTSGADEDKALSSIVQLIESGLGE